MHDFYDDGRLCGYDADYQTEYYLEEIDELKAENLQMQLYIRELERALYVGVK